MPIVTIEQVTAAGQPEDVAQKLADELGLIFKSNPQQLWVKFKTLRPEGYAENGGGIASPTFVGILLADWPDEPLRAALAIEAARCVAAVLGLEAGHVHVTFEPPGRGRVAFGGNLVT